MEAISRLPYGSNNKSGYRVSRRRVRSRLRVMIRRVSLIQRFLRVRLVRILILLIAH